MDTRTEIATRICAAFIASPMTENLSQGAIADKSVQIADMLMQHLAIPARNYRIHESQHVDDEPCSECGRAFEEAA